MNRQKHHWATLVTFINGAEAILLPIRCVIGNCAVTCSFICFTETYAASLSFSGTAKSRYIIILKEKKEENFTHPLHSHTLQSSSKLSIGMRRVNGRLCTRFSLACIYSSSVIIKQPLPPGHTHSLSYLFPFLFFYLFFFSLSFPFSFSSS